MNRKESRIVRALRRASPQLAACVLTLGAAACTGPGFTADPESDLDGLAVRLVEAAQARVDLRQARVWVAGIHQTQPQITRAGMSQPREDLIGSRLDHEFVIALAGRLNVLESELSDPPATLEGKVALGERATAYGATHVVIGEYVRQGDR